MLEVHSVTKRYGSLVALDRVSASFAPGEIHAVLGENGAGKSTLMAVMAGFTSPTEGNVTLDGTQLPLGRAFDCKRLGIEMIHQHFTLVPAFSVAENLALARLPGLFRRADVAERARPSLDAAERLGWAVDPGEKVTDLPVGARQRLEILKALGGEAKVLIFDEPTAVLAPDEVDDLLRVLRALRDEGRIVILIAHKLSEVLAIADRVTVLRKGQFVATAPRSEVDADRLASWMVGEMPPGRTAPENAVKDQSVALSAKGLVVRSDVASEAVRDVSFEVQMGEIFGIGGVDGNGQVELAEALAGVRPLAAGNINHQDEPVGYIPQDRQGDGLAMGLSVLENLLVGGYRRSELSRSPWLLLSKVAPWARGLIERFDIKVGSPSDRIAGLSGGNQQKVVVSRTLDAHPSVLIAVNPTRGLDFRAARFVHEQLEAARDAGAAIVLISTDLDELFALSDRTAFMSRGVLTMGSDAAALLGERP